MESTTLYTVKTSSWLAPLITAAFFAMLVMLFVAMPLLLPASDATAIALLLGLALAIGVMAAWLVWVGVHTRRCTARLTADAIELTAFRVIHGRGTRRLASARIPWNEVQSLVTENYDLVGMSGFRMELRNLFLFSSQGDFALYGYAWRDWAAFKSEIAQRSGRELDVPAAARSADIDQLRRHMRRNYRAVRVMSWISLALLALIFVAQWSATP